MRIVLPGDVVEIDASADSIESKPQKNDAIVIGPGLHVAPDSITALKAGLLVSNPPHHYIQSSQRRYIPSTSEPVLGVVLASMRHLEAYKVDIGAPHTALLNFYAFEGATKRNRPALEIGTVVFARVAVAHRDMDPEIECVAPNSGKAEHFGVLKDGFVFKVSLAHARRLADPKCPLLVALGERIAFESAVGFNGRVWVKSGSPRATVAIVNAIQHWESAVDRPREVAKVWMNRLVPQA
ncbi:hypothetical protein BJ742DRAFT_746495 [Cladochytrium replicatum]|nr:hypothetical protein BJ742DRAFT_746495 [Cladochytrium replicatum]